MKDIKNIIFDLGGVILNIDTRKTAMALEELGVKDLKGHLSQPALVSFFNDYETGKIDDNAFVRKLQSLAGEGTTEQHIIDAWNALLLDFPSERIELLRSLRKKYRLFLLSNTNEIHYKQFQQQIYLQTGSYLEDLFERTYYSHTINLRKPDVACYQFVIKENKLNPSETIFVDDSEVNITGAREAGLLTEHIHAGRSIMDINW
ncbi:MAG TPA: HAD family phosphatase [Chitinophagaceae bacterium]|nr:HAD family phosphatase [Chitinophagaceae bacterium]